MVNYKIDINVLERVYNKYKNEIFQKNGRAELCSDIVYQTLLSEFQGMNEKSIQTSISFNWKRVFKFKCVRKEYTLGYFKVA